ncbi:MAG: hypothetical protein V4526_02725 [Patescibacteria group bacterium]
MKWANFLHVYQPAEQQRDILEAIVTQCYRPIFTHIRDNKDLRLTININGALLELFARDGYTDLIDCLKEAGKDGRVEFTCSAKYHAFLPFLSKEEIIRQIQINNDTMKRYLGDSYKPRGFFPPEMGFKPELAPILNEMGFEWVILDEIALTGTPGAIDNSKQYKIKGTDMKVFFRDRRLSNLIMSAVVRSPETLKEAMKGEIQNDNYVITAMDGETFGHHRPGLEKMLFNVWSGKEYDLVNISDLSALGIETVEVQPVASTWASSKEDIDHNIQFLSWADPENKIHKWQNELLALTLKEVYAMDKTHPRYDQVRMKMDLGLASDHFWWASAKPWWSVEMIEDGAYRLLDTIHLVPDVSAETLSKASKLYENIISTAFNWQRTGRIREMMRSQNSILRIPFADRTVGKGGAEEGVFHAFIDMMTKLEKEAAARGEYEKAILWRDALYKLTNKLDIYDTVNAIDLLRIEVPHNEVEAVIEKYKEKYRAMRGGQPEQRGS